MIMFQKSFDETIHLGNVPSNLLWLIGQENDYFRYKRETMGFKRNKAEQQIKSGRFSMHIIQLK